MRSRVYSTDRVRALASGTRSSRREALLAHMTKGQRAMAVAKVRS
jgi:hypothetical protein